MKEKKDALRKIKIEKREAIPEEEHKGKSELIQEKLFSDKEFLNAKSVAFFVGIKKEVHTKEMIEHALEKGKRVCVPLCCFKKCELEFLEINSMEDLEIKEFGNFCLEEPKEECGKVSLEEIDLIIVPGLAFDLKGYRLGYGRGFYDKILGNEEFCGKSIGICFDFQLKEEIPFEEHDVKVHKIVTEERVVTAKSCNKE